MKYLFILLFLCSCATTPKGLNDFQRDMALRNQDYDLVLKDMEAKKVFVKDKDYLLHQLNYAMVLHYAGKYKQSNIVFKECQQWVDYGSDNSAVEDVIGFTVSNNKRKFQLDEYEVLSISFFKMLNALNLGEIQSAQAESRRLERLGRMLSQSTKPNLLEETAFHSYFAGIIWESQKSKDWSALDTSYIYYKKALKNKSSIPYLPMDLTRLAIQLRRDSDLEQFDKTLQTPPQYKDFVKSEMKQPTTGELIIVFTHGLGPRKGVDPENHLKTKSFPRMSTVDWVKIDVNGEDKGRTIPLLKFDSLAEANFKNAWSGVLGTIGNATVVDSHDYRAWEMLPKEIQLARIILDDGEHSVRFEVVGKNRVLETTVKIKKGQKTLVHIYEPY